jgi:hypothetical protein
VGISAKAYQQRLQPLLNLSTIQELVKTIVVSDEKVLKERKINEFTHGEKPSGEKIGTYSTSEMGQEYAYFKNQINPLAGFGNVDLLLSRSFTQKMFLNANGNNGRFIFNSTDNKTMNLKVKYGNEIMGLNQIWFSQRQKDIYRITLTYLIKTKYNIA